MRILLETYINTYPAALNFLNALVSINANQLLSGEVKPSEVYNSVEDWVSSNQQVLRLLLDLRSSQESERARLALLQECKELLLRSILSVKQAIEPKD